MEFHQTLSMASLPSIADFNEPISEADEIESVRNLQKHGDSAFKSKDYAQAVTCYSEALEIDSENAQILARRAVSYIELKEFSKAGDDARLLVKLNPHVPQGHYLLAVSLDNLKEYSQAVISFLNALRYDVKHRDQLADNVAVVASNICEFSEQALHKFEGMPPFQKLMTVGEALKVADQNAVCIEVLQTALDLQPLDSLHQQRALFLVAESHFTLGELDLAKDKYRQCLALALQDGNQQYEAKSYRKLAEISLRQNDLQQGIVYFEKLLSISNDLVSQHGEQKMTEMVGAELHKIVHETLCGAYRSMGDLPHALQHAKEHLESVAMDGDSKELLGNGHFTVASLQEAVGDYTSALEHYQSYFTATKAQKDRIGMGWSYGCLGRVYHCLCNYSLAQTYYEQQLQIAEKLGHLSMHATALRSLGDLADDSGMCEKALEYLQSYLRISRKLDEFETECKAYLRLGEVHQKNNNTEHAKYFYEQALNLADRTSQVELAQRSRCKLAYMLVTSLDEKEIAKAASLAETLVSHYEGLLKASKDNTFLKRSEIEDMLAVSYDIVQETLTSLNRTEEALEYTEANNRWEFYSIFDAQMQRPVTSGISEKEKPGGVSIVEICKLVNTVNTTVLYYALTDNSAITWVLKPGKGCIKMAKTQPCKGNCKDFIAGCMHRLRSGSSRSASLVYKTEYRALPLKDSQTHNLKNKFLSLSTDKKSTEEAIVPDISPARQLYEVLVSEVAEFIDGEDKVIVIPGKDLIHLPFDVLEDQDGRLFGEKISMAVFPSLQVLQVSLGHVTEDYSNPKTLQNNEDERRANSSPVYLDHMLRVTIPPSQQPHHIVSDISYSAPMITQQEMTNPTYVAFDTNYYHKKVEGKDTVKVHEQRHAQQMTNKGSTLISETWSGQEVPTARQGQVQPYKQSAGKEYFVVVGNPYLPEKVQLHGKIWEPHSELHFAQEEAFKVAKYLNTSAIVGKEAKKDRILAELQKATLIHLAMSGSWEDSSLACSPSSTAHPMPNGSYLEEDYLLSANDILGLKLQARLVVLSCCYGDRHRELSLTLPLTLLACGVHSVLILLWAVPDEVQDKFWHHFYQELYHGISISQAVVQAKKAIRNDERFKECHLWAPFCVIGQDEVINLCQVKQAMLDQLVNSTEADILKRLPKDALNPSNASGKDAASECTFKKLGPHLAGLLLHHQHDEDILPAVLHMVRECSKLVEQPPSIPPTPHVPQGIIYSPSAIPLLNRLGFHFQPQGARNDIPYVVFPQWDPEELLPPAVQALEGVIGCSVDVHCGHALANVLECQESLISALIDVLSFTKHMPEIQLRVTDAGVGQLWSHNIARPFLGSLGFQHVGSLLMFDGTNANKKLLNAGLQSLCALMGEKGLAMLNRLDMKYLGISSKPVALRSARKTPIKSALRSASTVRTLTPSLRAYTPLPPPPPPKRLPSLNPVLLGKDQISLSTPWWSQNVKSSEMKDKMRLAKSVSDTHKEYNQYMTSAQNWYHNSVLPQADESLSKIGQPKPRPSKVKVKAGATPSCVREPVHREPELTMEAVQQRRDYANFLLHSRKADITWRHEEALKKLYLPYVQNAKQSSAT
ncbi:uncharacterized protein [Amphiura filiformis]|uniref:uncharacterized protein n=1 Tax=Amphiura filiformis TaxID=82378 RepID=UPI003B2168C8